LWAAGLPVGVFGGKRSFMDQLAPLGPVYQAGTLSGNPLAMAAGLPRSAICRSTRRGVSALEATSKPWPRALRRKLRKAGFPHNQPRGLDVDLVLYAGPVTNYEQAAKSDTAAFGRFHRAMLEQGIWLPPSQFEAAFISYGAQRCRHRSDDRRGARFASCISQVCVIRRTRKRWAASWKGTTSSQSASQSASRTLNREITAKRAWALAPEGRVIFLDLLSTTHPASQTGGSWLCSAPAASRGGDARLAVRVHDRDARRRAARCSPRARRSSPSIFLHQLLRDPLAEGSLQSEVIAFHSTGSSPARAQCGRPPAAALQKAAGKTLPARR
jgi:hypothetical protein